MSRERRRPSPRRFVTNDASDRWCRTLDMQHSQETQPGSLIMSNASNADPRPTLEAPDDDPWIWLEDIDSPQATSWADAQTAKTLERFGGPAFLQDRNALAAIYDQPA